MPIFNPPNFSPQLTDFEQRLTEIEGDYTSLEQGLGNNEAATATAQTTATAAQTTANNALSVANQAASDIEALEVEIDNLLVPIATASFNGTNGSVGWRQKVDPASLITSLSRTGIGIYSVNITGLTEDAIIFASASGLSSSALRMVFITPSAGNLELRTATSSISASDAASVSFQIMKL
jgi:hypothetical protein